MHDVNTTTTTTLSAITADGALHTVHEYAGDMGAMWAQETLLMLQQPGGRDAPMIHREGGAVSINEAFGGQSLKLMVVQKIVTTGLLACQELAAE